MTVTVKAGHKNGQDLEFRMSGGVITILPKLPDAGDEYTRGQRRIIDARLAEGLADIKAGRTFGPFDSAEEMIAHMKAQLKKRGIAPKGQTVSMKADYSEGEVLGAESKAGPRQQGLALLLPHPGTNGNLRESRPLNREELPCSPDVL